MTDETDAIPRLGLGTWLRTGDEGYAAILAAIELGYRHIDTAQSYGTEVNVGHAIHASGLRRDEFFVTTKVTAANLTRDRFLPSLRESLDRMRLDQVDLTLIHWPSYRNGIPLAEHMESLAEAKASGLTRFAGVSNFTVALIEKSVALLGRGALATNQVELHPFLQNRRLAAACTANDILMTAYMPLAKGRVFNDPVLKEIGTCHGVDGGAASLAWLLAKGMIVIPASSRPEHMRANLAAARVRLLPEEIAAIDALDRGERIINPAGTAPEWDP